MPDPNHRQDPDPNHRQDKVSHAVEFRIECLRHDLLTYRRKHR